MSLEPLPRRPGRALRTARRWLLLAASVLAALPSAGVDPDAGNYPRSARSRPVTASPLCFEVETDVAIPGRARSGEASLRVVEGAFHVTTSTGTYVMEPGSGPPRVTGEESVSVSLDSGPSAPGWARHLRPPPARVGIVHGPSDLTAILLADGTVEGRESRAGHLLWQSRGSHRLSGAALCWGDYLIPEPLAGSRLEAFRWSDGALAGHFSLEDGENTFVSAPAGAGDRVAILASLDPESRTRLLVLRPRIDGCATASASPIPPRSP